MSRPVIDPLGEQAVDWMVRLSAGRNEPGLQAEFEAWLQHDPAHTQAWQRLQERVGSSFNVVRSLERRKPGQADEARRLLLTPPTSRRDVLRGLAAVGLLGGGLWLGARSHTGQVLLADLRTGTGERRTVVLADGSRLSLNADSAVDLSFSATERLIILHRGELVIQVTADPQRPLRVRSTQGEVRALGTRFMVGQERDATRLVVLEHSVRARLLDGSERDVSEGQVVLMGRERIETLSDDPLRRTAWLDGRLNVLNEPLGDVIDALRPYTRGVLRVAPEVQEMRVQGVFPLDDPQRTLQALVETLPIRIERYTQWVTLISAR
ncbi:FecR family protein [Pseudomonas syringae]|nr:FecR family protein [Pseudomonas syringae]MBD8792127.1 FecR family protein [Pseudomonas syringae]MBD8803389.1 FecR family protein [Pseudomonas syringae]MBD8814502.1 FecR family protein [Pseudomonas syringae]